MLLFVVWVVVYELIRPAPPTASRMSPGWWYGEILYLACALAAAFLAFRRRGDGVFKRLFGPAPKRWVARALAAGSTHQVMTWVCYLLGASVACTIASYPGTALDFSPHLLENPGSAPNWFYSVIVAPIGEEIFFRGLLLMALRERFGVRTAVIVSAVLFGMVHHAFMPQCISGILYAWLVIQTGSLWPSILAHALNNAVIHWASRGTARLASHAFPLAQDLSLHRPAGALLLLVACVTTYLSVRLVRDARPARIAAALAVLGLTVPMVAGWRADPASQPSDSSDRGPGSSDWIVESTDSVTRDLGGPFVSLAGGRAQLTLFSGECFSQEHLRQISPAVTPPPSRTPDPEWRADLGTAFTEVYVESDSLGKILTFESQQPRFWWWLRGGSALNEPLVGFAVRAGPWVERSPLRLLEVAGPSAHSAVDWPFAATVTVALREGSIRFNASAPDESTARSLLPLLDQRVKTIVIRAGEHPGDASREHAGRVLLFDLGHMRRPLNWMLGPLPLLIMGILFAAAWAAVGKRAGPLVPFEVAAAATGHPTVPRRIDDAEPSPPSAPPA